jgi:tetratricopeptide (TPR) repeat protein
MKNRKMIYLAITTLILITSGITLEKHRQEICSNDLPEDDNSSIHKATTLTTKGEKTTLGRCKHQANACVEKTPTNPEYTADFDINHEYIDPYIREENRSISTWTVIGYCVADSDAEYALLDDVLDMALVGSTPQVNIIILIDRWDGFISGRYYPYYDDTRFGNWTNTRIYYIEKNNWRLLKDLPELNMGKPDTLVNYVEWVVSNYPAQHYWLDLEGHGGGWYGFGWDQSHREDVLDTRELKTAFGAISERIGKKIDLVSYDSCIMGEIEVDYSSRAYADIFVHSEEYMTGAGYPYAWILQNLTAYPNWTAERLAWEIVKGYVDFHTDGKGTPGDPTNPPDDRHVTHSSIHALKLDSLTKAVDSFAQQLKKAAKTYNTEINKAKNSAQSYASLGEFDERKDLYDLALKIKTYVPDAAVQQSAQKVMDNVSSAVIHEKHGNRNPDSHGLVIYFPSRQYYNHTYEDTDFAQDTQWDEFLQAFYSNSEISNKQPIYKKRPLNAEQGSHVFAQEGKTELINEAPEDTHTEEKNTYTNLEWEKELIGWISYKIIKLIKEIKATP